MVELLEWAGDRPLFNLNEAQRALGEERDYLQTKIQRAVEKGELKRIERGKYTIHEEALIYASHVETPSYISLWSALRYYDLTTQEPRKVDIISRRDRGDLPDIRFHYTEDMFGFSKTNYRGVEIYMAEKEKLLIDCLSRKEVPVPETLELLKKVDIDRATEYAERTGRKSVKKRLGYLLEKTRGEEVQELRPDDRNYTPLNLSKPPEGEKNSRWMLTVNTDAI